MRNPSVGEVLVGCDGTLFSHGACVNKIIRCIMSQKIPHSTSLSHNFLSYVRASQLLFEFDFLKKLTDIAGSHSFLCVILT